jgi:hypothetical protein
MAALQASDATAKGYEQAILATREVVLDPTRAVLARWARSLATIGVDDTLVDEGYGVSYARALASFERSRHDRSPVRCRAVARLAALVQVALSRAFVTNREPAPSPRQPSSNARPSPPTSGWDPASVS